MDELKLHTGKRNPSVIRLAGVYFLTVEGDDRVYVGSTVYLARRLSEHLYLLKNGRHPSSELQIIFDQDPNVERIRMFYQVVDDDAELKQLEQEWMNQRKSAGQLINKSDHARVSSKGYVIAQSTRDKISAARSAHRDTPEVRTAKRERLSKIWRYGGDNPAARGITVNGIRYETMRKASMELGIDKSTLRRRGKSAKFQHYVLDELPEK